MRGKRRNILRATKRAGVVSQPRAFFLVVIRCFLREWSEHVSACRLELWIVSRNALVDTPRARVLDGAWIRVNPCFQYCAWAVLAVEVINPGLVCAGSGIDVSRSAGDTEFPEAIISHCW